MGCGACKWKSACVVRPARILARARREARFCVTLDKDFHEVLAESGEREPSVILLRMQGLRATGCTELLSEVWARYASELATGYAVTVTEKTMRVRKVPLVAGRRK